MGCRYGRSAFRRSGRLGWCRMTLSTQDALRGGGKSEQGAGMGGRGAVVVRWWVTDESWPLSDIATGYKGRGDRPRRPSGTTGCPPVD